MQLIEASGLTRISSFLDHLDVGYTILCGSFHAFSCKISNVERELFQQLNSELQNCVDEDEYSHSPFGPLSKTSSRNTLIHLILTLNHVYPDYDFSFLKARDFEEDLAFEATFQTYLSEASKIWEDDCKDNRSSFIDAILRAIDEVVDLRNCNVYTHNQSIESDRFADEHVLWDFNFFFYNKKTKKVVLFDCREMNKSSLSSDTLGNSSDENDIGTSSDWEF